MAKMAFTWDWVAERGVGPRCPLSRLAGTLFMLGEPASGPLSRGAAGTLPPLSSSAREAFTSPKSWRIRSWSLAGSLTRELSTSISRLMLAPREP
jgi:hypothetical protein